METLAVEELGELKHGVYVPLGWVRDADSMVLLCCKGSHRLDRRRRRLSLSLSQFWLK